MVPALTWRPYARLLPPALERNATRALPAFVQRGRWNRNGRRARWRMVGCPLRDATRDAGNFVCAAQRQAAGVDQPTTGRAVPGGRHDEHRDRTALGGATLRGETAGRSRLQQ